MQEIDTSGRTSFGELDEGIYLLAQIGNVESGTDKFESAPFLVNIPSCVIRFKTFLILVLKWWCNGTIDIVV